MKTITHFQNDKGRLEVKNDVFTEAEKKRYPLNKEVTLTDIEFEKLKAVKDFKDVEVIIAETL